MANKSISMSKLRHLLQLYIQGRSKKLISDQTGIARNTLKKYIKDFIDSGLTMEVLNGLSDKELEEMGFTSSIQRRGVKDVLQGLTYDDGWYMHAFVMKFY